MRILQRASQHSEFKLFKSGQMKRLVDFNISSASFTAIDSVDVSTISKNNISIFCYSIYEYSSSSLDLSFLASANTQATGITVNTSGSGEVALLVGYQQYGGRVYFGIINPYSTAYTVIPPYRIVKIPFGIFYY